MKARYYIVLLTLFFVSFRAEALNDTISISTNDTFVVVSTRVECPEDSVQNQMCCRCEYMQNDAPSLSYSDGVSTLALIENAINNVYTLVGIYIALVSLLVAIMGFLGFQGIRKYKNNVDDTIKKLKAEADLLNKKGELNNQYLQKINQWTYSNANAIAQTTGPQSAQGRNLMQQSTVNYYLMKLFLSKDKHEIDNCINYIKTQGGKKEIDALKFIVDNDPDRYKRDKANQAIGYIQGSP